MISAARKLSLTEVPVTMKRVTPIASAEVITWSRSSSKLSFVRLIPISINLSMATDSADIY